VAARMTRRRRTRSTIIGLIVGVSMMATACGNNPQSHPVKLARDQVPFGLLEPATTTIPTTTLPLSKYPFVVYFEGDDGIIPAVRTSSAPPDPTTVMQALLAGPTVNEGKVRIRSAIPPLAVGRVGKVVRHTVTVDLQQPFTDVTGSEQKIALAQIVLTMTWLHDVTKVRFLLDGEPVSVPRGDGTLTRGPVSRGDYVTKRKP
jgi:spore germination protein GerM